MLLLACVFVMSMIDSSITCHWSEWSVNNPRCRWVNKQCRTVLLRSCSCDGNASKCGSFSDSMRLFANVTIKSMCNNTTDCPMTHSYSRWSQWSKWDSSKCPAKRFRSKTCLTSPLYSNIKNTTLTNFTCVSNKSDTDSRYDLCQRGQSKRFFNWEFTQLLLFILIVMTAAMGFITFICKRKRISFIQRQECAVELSNRDANHNNNDSDVSLLAGKTDDKQADKVRLVTISECSETEEK